MRKVIVNHRILGHSHGCSEKPMLQMVWWYQSYSGSGSRLSTGVFQDKSVWLAHVIPELLEPVWELRLLQGGAPMETAKLVYSHPIDCSWYVYQKRDTCRSYRYLRKLGSWPCQAGTLVQMKQPMPILPLPNQSGQLSEHVDRQSGLKDHCECSDWSYTLFFYRMSRKATQIIRWYTEKMWFYV